MKYYFISIKIVVGILMTIRLNLYTFSMNNLSLSKQKGTLHRIMKLIYLRDK